MLADFSTYAQILDAYTHIPHSIPISARINYKSSKSPFSAFSLHLMKVRIFASTDLKFPFSPAKMRPIRDDYYTRQRINRPEYS